MRLPIGILSLVLVAGITTSSCEISCTLIGCFSGLQVNLESQPTGAYKVELLNASNAATATYDCTGGNCMGIIFNGYEATSATIRITTTTGTRTTVFTGIAYVTSKPNGPRCGPTCKLGTVTVPLPA